METGAANNGQLKSSKLFDVSNFSAIVTGGRSGIGLMITQTLAANGAKIYITGRREEAPKTVVKTYDTSPGRIIALPADISKKEEITRISAESISKHLMKSDPRAWADTFSTNVSSQFFVSAAFLPLLAMSLASRFSPSIMSTTSIPGVMKSSSNGQLAYASLSRILALDGNDGHDVPRGKGSSEQYSAGSFPCEASNPAGRYGHETDTGACLLFLAGLGGVFLNGQVIYPDGAVLPELQHNRHQVF
ncbi:short chain dehydrogenase/reductase [Diplocarpon mali]|nr:short chain dehydrogenase/reductase [Diplocarpon mali]